MVSMVSCVASCMCECWLLLRLCLCGYNRAFGNFEGMGDGIFQ
jgi:hypothetical protein